MAVVVALAGEVVSMTGEVADKLLTLPGDAALLYIALCRGAAIRSRLPGGWAGSRGGCLRLMKVSKGRD